MNKMSTKMLVEAGVLIALAQVLSYVKVFEAPYGGSVTAGSMVPIIFYAIRWGLGPGFFAATVYGVLQFILGPKYTFHILSILLDYVVAFGLLGLAGISRKSYSGVFAGVLLAVFGRFIAHLLSGVIIWASMAPEGMNPWVYSTLYNGAYLVPELVISWVIIGLLYKPMQNLPTHQL